MATVEVMVEATVAATVAATVTTMAVARPGQGTRLRRRARGAGWALALPGGLPAGALGE